MTDGSSGQHRLIESAWRQFRAVQDSDTTLPPPSSGSGLDGVACPADAVAGYRLIRELHRGGQGVVFQALQESTRRNVAIKVLLEGPFASRAARRRFEREIELAGRLRHPNIVSIFHSGMTADGRQYYVMDYIRGLALTSHVRQNRLDLQQTLELFSRVCDAVQCAHQHGIIHRDLKPSNILVDDYGSPRVLDFGLAKWTAGPAETAVSISAEPVGTLRYMSPEQTRGHPDAIDSRTDVYSLAVVLYEMLTGHHPYPVEGHASEILEHIVRTPPAHPSRIWSPDSGVHRSSAPRLRPGRCPIDRDIETIVMRGLAKEPPRRYQSAGELGRDLRHYLAGEPIEARRDHLGYVLRKWLGRHKARAAAAAAFVIVIIAGLGVALTFWQISRHRLAEARQARSDLADVADFQSERVQSIDPQRIGVSIVSALRQRVRAALSAQPGAAEGDAEGAIAELDRLLRHVNSTDLGRSVMYGEIFQPTEQAIGRQFSGQPLLEALLRADLGSVGRSAGLLEEAEAQLTRAVELDQGALGDEHPQTLEALNGLALLFLKQGRAAEAECALRSVLRACRDLPAGEPQVAFTAINYLGEMLLGRGRYAEAEALLRQAARDAALALGDEDSITLIIENNLADACVQRARYSEAEKLYERVLDARRRVLGDDCSPTLTTMNNLANLYVQQRRFDEAERLYQEVHDKYAEEYGEEHPYALTSLSNLARVDRERGRLEASRDRLLEVLDGCRRALGEAHPDTLFVMNELAGVYLQLKQESQAAELLEHADELCQRTLGLEHPVALTTLQNLAELNIVRHRLDEAEAALREVVDGRARLMGTANHATVKATRRLGQLLVSQRRFAEAEPLLAGDYAACQDSFGLEHLASLSALHSLATLYFSLGRYAESKILYERGLQIVQRTGQQKWEVILGSNLAETSRRMGLLADAEPLLDRALQTSAGLLSEAERATLFNNLALVHRDQGRYREAEVGFRAALNVLRETLGPGQPVTLDTLASLADLQSRCADPAAAENLWLQLLEDAREERGTLRFRKKALESLMFLYEDWGRPGDAAYCRTQLEAVEEAAGQ